MWLTLGICLCSVALAMAQEQRADSSNVLENIVIEENFEAELEEEKPPIQIDLDFSSLIKMEQELKWTSIDELTTLAGGQSTASINLQLSAPQLANIAPAPVKTFHTQFKKILRWQLDITASDGALFRTLSGNGTPPSMIHWDGRSDTGQALLAGENYAYTFTAVDKAGNKRTFPGETFVVPSFYLVEEGKLLIGLADSEVFSKETLGLRPEARQYAREIATLLRYFSTTGTIEIASKNRNAEDFLVLLAQDLVCDVELFEQRPARSGNTTGFEIYVE